MPIPTCTFRSGTMFVFEIVIRFSALSWSGMHCMNTRSSCKSASKPIYTPCAAANLTCD